MGEDLVQIIFQRRHANGQWVHERVLNHTNHSCCSVAQLGLAPFDFMEVKIVWILTSFYQNRCFSGYSPFRFQIYLLMFSHSLVSDSLWPHGLQHARLPCPSPSPGACSNSCPLSRWCHPSIWFSVVPFSSHLQSFPASGSFLMSSALRIRWPMYWSFSFSISPPNDYSGLISFRINWFDLLAVQQYEKIPVIRGCKSKPKWDITSHHLGDYCEEGKK